MNVLEAMDEAVSTLCREMDGDSVISESLSQARNVVAEMIEALQAVLADCHDLDMFPSNERGRDVSAFELVIAVLEKASP